RTYHEFCERQAKRSSSHFMASLRLVAALAPSPPPPSRREPPPPAARLARGVALAAAAATVAAAAASPPALAALAEPANALSLPTWAVHVSSVAEWVTAMALVWDYGERTGLKGWKGLSWGMGSTSRWSDVRVHLAFLLQFRVSRDTCGDSRRSNGDR
uniref:Uncharacterized protein n=1 Tax=Aegilops tauschii subsp. strangulata TaxID=200361 RepID=A0A453LCP1_AEGTS